MRDYESTSKALRCCRLTSERGCAECPFSLNSNEKCASLLPDAASAIEELLAVVPKRGEWITTRTWEHDGEPYCSICGFEQSFTRFQKFKYCPRCGAKMEAKE